MYDATGGAGFACADLTTFCRLDELGLEVTGQRLQADRAVLTLATMSGVLITAALANGNQRFRLAAEPAFAILAAMVLIPLWKRRPTPDAPRRS